MVLSSKSSYQARGRKSSAFICFVAINAATVITSSLFAPAAESQQNQSTTSKPDMSKIAPGGWVFLNPGIANMTTQKFQLPTSAISYPVAGLTIFPYYQASPQLKAFLNSATIGGLPLSQQPATPSLGTNALPQTDTTPRPIISIPPGQELDKHAAVKMAIINKRRNEELLWMVAHDPGQAFGLPGDNDAIALMSPGTMFSAGSARTMVLRCGTMWVITGARPAAVLTKNGAVAIKPYSIVAIEQTWFNRLRAADLFGPALELQLSYRGKASKIIIEKGQEYTISETTVASAGISDYTDPAFSGAKEAASSQSTSPIPGLAIVSDSVKAESSSFIGELKGLTPPFSNAKMNADFQEMFAAYGISAEMRHDEISKALLQRLNLASKPAGRMLSVHNQNASLLSTATAARPVANSLEFAQKAEDLKSISIGRQGIAKYLSSTILEQAQDGRTLLKSGEALFVAAQSMIVQSNDCCVYLRPGSTVQIVAKNGCLALRNIKETEPGSVKVRLKTQMLNCGAGNELMIGNNAPDLFREMRNDGVGRRHLHSIEIASSNVVVAMSEIDLSSLMQYSPIMRKLYKSRLEHDRLLVQEIMKAIVALNLVSKDQGGYQAMAGLAGAQ